jgi:hypothetical protein
MKIKDRQPWQFLCRNIRTWLATPDVARRGATMQTSVPMGTAITSHQLDQVKAITATTAGLTALDGVASSMMVSHYSKREAWSHRSVLLDEHENSSKENSNQEPGCIYTIEYWMWLNTIEYVKSESSSLFFNHPCVERQLCIVNRGYAIVTEQQWLDRTNKFRSTYMSCQHLKYSFLCI